MIDCVGYIVPSALGYIENEQPRMVMTPWFDSAVPFNMAAEIGTQKVINEHSTIGLVVTTDGSFSEIPREEYAEAEARVINELKSINKPFIVLLNSKKPYSEACLKLSEELSEKYAVKVLPVNCLDLTSQQISSIIKEMLYEFPVKELRVDFPKWITTLEKENEIKKSIYTSIKKSVSAVSKMRDGKIFAAGLCNEDKISSAGVTDIDLSSGKITVKLQIDPKLFYGVLSEKVGLEITDEQALMSALVELAKAKKEYDRFKTALDEVESTGYGIVMPTMEQLSLEEPEIMRQGGRYGVRLKASAPSIHLLKADITTEVAPIVGSESQSEELIMYLLKEFEEDPAKIWESNIFGKSLNSLVNEGLHNKLYKMPTDARMKIQETLERVINEGCSGLICIIL